MPELEKKLQHPSGRLIFLTYAITRPVKRLTAPQTIKTIIPCRPKAEQSAADMISVGFFRKKTALRTGRMTLGHSG
ncbi:MAG: hypothetical protein ACRCU9_03970 [Iodobacter sp.]